MNLVNAKHGNEPGLSKGVQRTKVLRSSQKPHARASLSDVRLVAGATFPSCPYVTIPVSADRVFGWSGDALSDHKETK